MSTLDRTGQVQSGCDEPTGAISDESLIHESSLARDVISRLLQTEFQAVRIGEAKDVSLLIDRLNPTII